jgi:hypothetical protein
MSIKLSIPLNIKNKNNRIYTNEEFEKHIDKYMSKELRFGTFLTSIDDETMVPIKCISHSIDNLYIKNENLIVEITILDTPYGIILKQLYENDTYIGLSPCSYGSIEDNIVKIEELVTFAIVTMENDSFFIGNKLRKYKLKELKKYENTER